MQSDHTNDFYNERRNIMGKGLCYLAAVTYGHDGLRKAELWHHHADTGGAIRFPGDGDKCFTRIMWLSTRTKLGAAWSEFNA
jgi:hypothetical protein